jgi:uncharacterized membrane protein YdjX (TVP38/TMEM64 family)
MSREGHGKLSGVWRLAAFACVVAAALLVIRFTGLSFSHFTPSRIRTFIQGLGVWGPAVFVAIYALRAGIPLFPVGIMSLAGGLAFGRWLGTAYILAGAMLGSSLAFGISRAAGRRFIEQFAWLHRGRIRALDEGVERNGFKVVLVARLIPAFQYDALNFSAGLSKIRFRDYAVATLVGMIPGSFVSAFLGDSLTNVRSPQFIVALSVFVLLALVPLFSRWVRRVRRGRHGSTDA